MSLIATRLILKCSTSNSMQRLSAEEMCKKKASTVAENIFAVKQKVNQPWDLQEKYQPPSFRMFLTWSKLQYEYWQISQWEKTAIIRISLTCSKITLYCYFSSQIMLLCKAAVSKACQKRQWCLYHFTNKDYQCQNGCRLRKFYYFLEIVYLMRFESLHGESSKY